MAPQESLSSLSLGYLEVLKFSVHFQKLCKTRQDQHKVKDCACFQTVFVILTLAGSFLGISRATLSLSYLVGTEIEILRVVLLRLKRVLAL